MQDLIEALSILNKYAPDEAATHCEHDVLLVCGVPLEVVSADDRRRLKALGFSWCQEHDTWASYRWGSC